MGGQGTGIGVWCLRRLAATSKHQGPTSPHYGKTPWASEGSGGLEKPGGWARLRPRPSLGRLAPDEYQTMSNADEMRWRQRLDNFSNALAQLSAACNQPGYTDLERSGLVQTFEFSFELAWKTLQDLLFYEGYGAKTPRAAIRQGFESEYLDEEDCETLLDALEKRNLLSHTYRKELALEAETLIRTCYHPALARLHATLQAHRQA